MLVLGGFAASLWVALVYTLGRDLPAHERLLVAGGGAVVFLLMLLAITVTCALDGITAAWRRRAPAAHRKHGW